MPIASWTTVDLGVQVDLSGIADSFVFAGTEIIFNVRNLFNQEPPSVDRQQGALRFGFDTANADGRGRTLSFQIKKRW